MKLNDPGREPDPFIDDYKKNAVKETDMIVKSRGLLSIRTQSKPTITLAPDDQEATMAHYGLVEVYNGDNAEVE